MTVGPLVSCCMPTKNPPEMVARAIASFAGQTYPQRELVVVGTHDHLRRFFGAAWAETLDNFSVEEVCVPPGLSIGELRNVANRRANGSIVAHWDDDDWSHPTRLERQVNILRQSGSRITGHQRYYAINEEKVEAWVFDGASLSGQINPWVAGGTLAYWRWAWEHESFNTALPYGEDTAWCAGSFGVRADAIGNPLYVARLHPGNTSPKAPGTLGWTRVDYDMVARFMEEK